MVMGWFAAEGGFCILTRERGCGQRNLFLFLEEELKDIFPLSFSCAPVNLQKKKRSGAEHVGYFLCFTIGGKTTLLVLPVAGYV